MLVLSSICFVLTVLLYSQVRQAPFLYFLWLMAAGLNIAYQRSFLFTPVMKRPLHHEAIISVLFVMDLAALVAVAVLCRVGWIGVGFLVVAYFCFGRLAGQLARRCAIKDALRMLDKQAPDMAPDSRAWLARTLFEFRQQAYLRWE